MHADKIIIKARIIIRAFSICVHPRAYFDFAQHKSAAWPRLIRSSVPPWQFHNNHFTTVPIFSRSPSLAPVNSMPMPQRRQDDSSLALQRTTPLTLTGSWPGR